MAGGCIPTLYRIGLIQNTGFLYDCYLYPARDPGSTEERDRYRRAFWQALTARPPGVLVVSSDECGPPDFAYHKLDRWPLLANLLAARYRLASEIRPTQLQRWGGKPATPYGYRLYVLRDPR